MDALKYKQGCLIEAAKSSEIDVIAQQCNCHNTRANGIAPQIDRAFPEAGTADDATVSGDMQKLGQFSKGINEEHGVTIYNLYGQYDFGTDNQKTNYLALEMSLLFMLFDMDATGLYGANIGFPKLGCGLGGGDWPIVEEMIVDIFCKEGYNVTIFER